MATFIRCLNIEDRNQILVNGKTVRKDMDGTWAADEILSMSEAKAFNAFRETIENHGNLSIRAAEYELSH